MKDADRRLRAIRIKSIAAATLVALTLAELIYAINQGHSLAKTLSVTFVMLLGNILVLYCLVFGVADELIAHLYRDQGGRPPEDPHDQT